MTILGADDERIAAETWTSDETDLRHDPSTKAQILAFTAMHGVRETAPLTASSIVDLACDLDADDPARERCRLGRSGPGGGVDDIRRAANAGWIDPESPIAGELDDIEDAPGEAIEEARELNYPIDDVSEATSWSACFAEHQPGKVGRNDPCPCGSGKKYKKRCGG